MYDNLQDIQRFVHGTMRFTFDGVAYGGHIATINYVPLGPGGINVTLLSLMSVTEIPIPDAPAIPDIPLDFTFSLMFAEVTSNPRELIVEYVLVAPDHFDKIISFRMRD
jgi:hypothetical protein